MSSRTQSPPGSGVSSASSRGPVRRLLKELDVWRGESKDEVGIERLGPVDEDDLLRWEAVINGRGVGGGYDDGRWLLAIQIPSNYPMHPPAMRFATSIIHANIALETGEICLDLLKDKWSGTYTVLECVRAVRMLLSYPQTDSPLNVDVAALLRGGDLLGAQALVECWIGLEGGRYDGS